MIHNVYFWLKPDLDAAQRAEFAAEVAALISIDRVASGTVGRPAATAERTVTDKSFDYHLGLRFATVADHDAYQEHPAHRAFVERCRGHWQNVVVYDSESAP